MRRMVISPLGPAPSQVVKQGILPCCRDVGVLSEVAGRVELRARRAGAGLSIFEVVIDRAELVSANSGLCTAYHPESKRPDEITRFRSSDRASSR